VPGSLIGIALAPVVVALAQAGAGSTAWSSGRPPECTFEGGGAANVWERAKAPDLRKYCDLVASAASKLAGTAAMAQAALVAAREADAIVAGRAAPLVLEGRALAALGKTADALGALEGGRARDPAALDDPLALHAWGRVLARSGRYPEALTAYRALLPRTSALSSSERAASAVEAGLVGMSVGPEGIDDAVAALREAAREAQDDAATVAVTALALALDRRGDASEARALLADRVHGDPRAAFEGGRAKELLAVAPGEEAALVAFALESADAAGAREGWTEYLASGKATPGAALPWDAHARMHLESLQRLPPLAGGSTGRRGR
jgi:tetratricopeptide (TPR) repeat protein